MIQRVRFPFQLLTTVALVTLLSACSPNRPTITELTLAATPGAFPSAGGDVEVAATVLTNGGVPIPNVQVSFTASGGSLSAGSAPTDAEGIARVRLASAQPVTVRAKAQEREVELAVNVETTIELSLTPAEPRRNQVVRIHLALRSFGQPRSGQVTLAFGNGDTQDLGHVDGETSTTYRWAEEGDFNLTATLREGSFETKSTVRVEVRGGGPFDDQIDASQVIWLSPATTDVSDWAITSEVHNVSVNGSTVCIDHSKSGVWPLVSIGDPRDTPNIEGNILIVVNINGQWYGGGFDWMGGGRICKTVDPSEYGRDQIRVWPLDASWHGPRSGETVGLLITTPSSNRIPVRSVNERTPIILVTWP